MALPLLWVSLAFLSGIVLKSFFTRFAGGLADHYADTHH